MNEQIPINMLLFLIPAAFNECFRFACKIWVAPWLKKTLEDLLELREELSPSQFHILVLMFQLTAISIRWQTIPFAFPALLVSTIHNATLNNNWPFSDSKIVFLPTRPRVLIQPPFYITILILQRPSSNLETSHRHSWAYFRQFHTLISRLNKHMMPDFNAIFNVLECDNSTS